jgi:DNA-binding response OmpR family regulator
MAELRVLACDDDTDMLELMLRRLDKMGFKPDRASDGGVATTLIKENLYDLIVTDIYMPEATGLELLALAKQRDPQVQVVIVTASATLDNAIDALNHGAFGYLSKPFDHLSVFDTTVSRALEFRQLSLSNRRMAEAQKMRGDMLEDEVAKRVGQLREKQQGLLDLLNCLPDGIVVVEEGGKLLMTSPAAEQWMARDRRSEDQPIAQFLGQVHSEWAENSGYAQLGEDSLRLLAVDYPHPNGRKRKAVIIRRAEDAASAGPGTLAVDSLTALKEGLAWLFRQKLNRPMQERIRDLANHVSTLEQLTGRADAPSARLPRSTSPLAPATLPVYLRHEPKLDKPGAKWEEAEQDAARENGKQPEAVAEPDTQPRRAARAEAAQPAVQAVEQTVAAPEPEPEPAEAPVEAQPAAERTSNEGGEAEFEAEGEANRVEVTPGAPEAEALEDAAPEAETLLAEASEPLEPEALESQAQEAMALEAESPELQQQTAPDELSTAPTRVLSHHEPLPEAKAPAAAALPAQAGAKAADTGRVPLWQRFSKGRSGAAEAPSPARGVQPARAPEKPLPAEPPEIEPQTEEPEPLVELAARLEGLGGAADEPVEPKVPERRARPSIASAKAKAVVAARAAAAEAPPVSPPQAEPVAPPASRRRPKVWPPKLPSQDPDFDPELDVTG